ncbi:MULTISPECIES: YozE family protein [Ligilactobacillus]|nr:MULTISPECIES: YozE family protein [Ligilactobacillus]MBM6862754.1 YozE family protein [Ligilactobacillus aviarius]MDM8278604.1 YozE family protein [Ligilactobacillus aviarius]MDO3392450.1 YozE family protein [Ligilactobacillus sp. 110_WCHN]
MMRRQSFYRYLMSLRDPNKHDEVTQFANDAFYDQGFPKQADDYHEVSDYLEMNASYLPSMSIFDQVWQGYTDKMDN